MLAALNHAKEASFGSALSPTLETRFCVKPRGGHANFGEIKPARPPLAEGRHEPQPQTMQLEIPAWYSHFVLAHPYY